MKSPSSMMQCPTTIPMLPKLFRSKRKNIPAIWVIISMIMVAILAITLIVSIKHPSILHKKQNQSTSTSLIAAALSNINHTTTNNNIYKHVTNKPHSNNKQINKYQADGEFREDMEQDSDPTSLLLLSVDLPPLTRSKRYLRKRVRPDVLSSPEEEDEINSDELFDSEEEEEDESEEGDDGNGNSGARSAYHDASRPKPASYSPITKNYYTKQESKRIQKYDLLGSGNFEIIRGGILDKLDSPNRARTRQRHRHDDSSQEEDDDDDKVGSHRLDEDNQAHTPPAHQDDEHDSFEPFNFDLFGNDPILQGFQGYDHFAAASQPIKHYW